MNMNYINSRIQTEVCNESINQLSDESLMHIYSSSESVKRKIDEFKTLLKKYDELLLEHPPEIAQTILLNDCKTHLIPAGTKGVIRGNRFNQLVKNKICSFGLDTHKYEIQFETGCTSHPTSEIPDWYILEKDTLRVIIGMNQLSLWGGGQQTNRGSKYIINSEHNTQNSKLVCVVCTNIQFKSPNSKEYKLFEIGFQNNTICYLNNLHNIITSYYADKTELYSTISSCLDIDLGPTVLLNSNTIELNA